MTTNNREDSPMSSISPYWFLLLLFVTSAFVYLLWNDPGQIRSLSLALNGGILVGIILFFSERSLRRSISKELIDVPLSLLVVLGTTLLVFGTFSDELFVTLEVGLLVTGWTTYGCHIMYPYSYP